MKKANLSISEIRPYWRNPRVNDRTVEVVRRSIERYGYISPIIVDKEKVIVAGHARYMALTQIGAKRADVIIADMHPDLIKQYRIIDNKSSEIARWDMTALAHEMKGLALHEQFSKIFPNPADMFNASSEGTDDRAATRERLKEDDDKKEQEYKRLRDKTGRDLGSVIDCPNCGRTIEFEED